MIAFVALFATLGLSIVINVALAARCYYLSRSVEGLEFVLDGLGAEAKVRKQYAAKLRHAAADAHCAARASELLSEANEIEKGGAP